jgi:ABC-type bacteriocin/lantibiotic exporter with double-glycine peptidase domain
MVLSHFGEAVTEADISDAVGCTPEDGTSPANLARYLRKRGYIVRSKTHQSLADIRADLKRGRLCIVAYQAWAQGVDLAASNDHGHYSVVVGVSDRVTLCDPSAKTKHTHLDSETFLARWHDRCAKGRNYERWALTVRRK